MTVMKQRQTNKQHQRQQLPFSYLQHNAGHTFQMASLFSSSINQTIIGPIPLTITPGHTLNKGNHAPTRASVL